jgi:putative two-component system hydrogenase maturation factor HypX/HoxX
MRILLLAHSFNGLTQRLFCALREDGHAVSVEFDINDSVTEEAVALWRPDVVLSPYLKRRIPDTVWRRVPCLVVHPGPAGDRGPASLDWALLDGASEWGVTVLQADGEYDAGAVWGTAGFDMRAAPKSSLYRREVGQAAVLAVRGAIARGGPVGGPVRGASSGSLSWSMNATPAAPLRAGPPAALRRADAAHQRTADWLRIVHAADGHPGALDAAGDAADDDPGTGRWRVFDAHAASEHVCRRAADAAPGSWVARRGPALLRRTVDGAVWVGHLRRQNDELPPLKRPASVALADMARALPEWDVPLQRDDGEHDELRLEVFGPPGARIGWLSFDFHNGAMSTRQCVALREALQAQRALPLQVLVLAGGSEFFSNGIHLHDIEAAAHTAGDSAADASMRNIEAMDDVVQEILTSTDRLVIAALRGNAGAGGCFLALAADHVWAHAGVVLNPHYRNMGNLHGSEYWTYTLPRRVGAATAAVWRQQRLPMNARQAAALGLVDAVLGDDAAGFESLVRNEAQRLATAQSLPASLAAKQSRRRQDEAARPLAAYREDELQRMRRNFYGFDPSYHVARHHFVHRKPMAWTPRHLALHREPA